MKRNGNKNHGAQWSVGDKRRRKKKARGHSNRREPSRQGRQQLRVELAPVAHLLQFSQFHFEVVPVVLCATNPNESDGFVF